MPKGSASERAEVGLGSLWGHFEVTLVYEGDFVSLRYQFGISAESVWVYEAPFFKNTFIPPD